jgi:hypothetical protein
VWTFASAIENDQNTAVGRLPKNAKESTQNHMRTHVLNAYLGIDTRDAGTQFREPPKKR